MLATICASLRTWPMVALAIVTLGSMALLDPARAAEPAASGQVAWQGELAARMQALGAPGALLGIYRPGHPPIELALGLADVENQRPMSVDCSFRIASISKVLVGTTLLAVADETRTSLDEPISKFVDGVPNGDRISLRQLGSHRSGLFNHIESREVKNAFAAEPQRWWTTDELLAFSLEKPVYFEPGAEHHYANVNTVLLARVIEKLSGNPWPDEVRRRVMVPLGLEHTRIPTDNTLPVPYAEGYALGTATGPFFHRGDVRHRVTETSPSWWGPAGCVVSTLADLGRMCEPLARGDLLSETMRAELHRWTQADQAGFDYGFHIERTRGRIGHDGDVPGYQTVMRYLPERRITVVAMCNLYGWSIRGMPANALAEIALEHLDDLP